VSSDLDATATVVRIEERDVLAREDVAGVHQTQRWKMTHASPLV
jgi:hypothetical protein